MLLIAVIIMVPAWAQKETANIQVKGSPEGVYLELKGISPRTGYEVYRKAEKGDFKSIGSFAPAATAKAFYQRMLVWSQVLDNYTPPSKALSDTLWKRYHQNPADFQSMEMVTANLAFGNAFIDTSAVLGKTYQYKLSFKDTAWTVASEKKAYALEPVKFAPMIIHNTIPGIDYIQLEWITPAFNTSPFFEVLRRTSGSRSGFTKIHPIKGLRTNNSGDSTIFIVIDSTAVPGITYDYFLASRGYLGNAGNHSDTVRFQAGGRENVPAVYNLRTRSDSIGITLYWEQLKPNPALQNILVLRSEDYDSGYSLLKTLPVTDTLFTDVEVEGGKNYYYQLIVQGPQNFSLPTPRISGIFMGKVFMVSPENIEAQATEEGIQLSWDYRNRGKVRGFNIYRATSQHKRSELVGTVISIKDSGRLQYIDTTILSGKRTYYYALSALSKTSSSGPLSDWVAVRPTVENEIPAPTQVRPLWLNDSVVSVTWKDLQRSHSGILAYEVYKNDERLKKPTKNHHWTYVEINEFKDTLQPGQDAWYWIKTIGVNQTKEGFSSPIHITTPVDKPLPPGSVNGYKQSQSIVLSWNKALNSKINKYNIYRAINTDEVALIGSVDADEDVISFKDDKIKKGALYFYYITSVNQYDIESEPSTEIHVRY